MVEKGEIFCPKKVVVTSSIILIYIRKLGDENIEMKIEVMDGDLGFKEGGSSNAKKKGFKQLKGPHDQTANWNQLKIRSTRSPWTKQPMAIDNDPSVRLGLLPPLTK
ncbi:hypothetical protein MA16_Dca007017 [Dendrobium catenatum]|uniref:Uncharacterized protein n=1 Tax=Dendrobium catenatum TaxID=906689 RepID=A0A2I0VX44_9ASPA|nr:hypothetical protein MA16_Dca007017 [Dendrobium catenatum]